MSEARNDNSKAPRRAALECIPRIRIRKDAASETGDAFASESPSVAESVQSDVSEQVFEQAKSEGANEQSTATRDDRASSKGRQSISFDDPSKERPRERRSTRSGTGASRMGTRRATNNEAAKKRLSQRLAKNSEASTEGKRAGSRRSVACENFVGSGTGDTTATSAVSTLRSIPVRKVIFAAVLLLLLIFGLRFCMSMMPITVYFNGADSE
ncbi:MAG: hypothetical protein IJH04_07450, partial [Eggerthellaceae bacterium]|nr:hypothetical protein [Eggerthellaceae bacterium]